MGGSDPLFEEAKMGDSLDLLDRTYYMFNAHPIYCCTALGTFVLTILIYVFL